MVIMFLLECTFVFECMFACACLRVHVLLCASHPLSFGQLLLQPLVSFLSDLHHRRASQPRQALTQSAALLPFLSRQEVALTGLRLQTRHAAEHRRKSLIRANCRNMVSGADPRITFHCGCAAAPSKPAAWEAGRPAGRWGGWRGAVPESVCDTERWAGCSDGREGAVLFGSVRRARTEPQMIRTFPREQFFN